MLQSKLTLARPAWPCNAFCQSQKPKIAQQTIMMHYHDIV